MLKNFAGAPKVIQDTGSGKGTGWYKADGSTVIDENGNVVGAIVPSDIPLAHNKVLAGNSSNLAAPFTEVVTFSGTPATISPTASSTTPTSSTPTFTGTAPVSSLNLATPAFSGTGLTAAGQAITTTDNQTMTLNQCAGMWLLSATQATPPNLILSNTAVAGAPAVLTVQGAASTDAGAYKIVKSLTPIGTVSAPTISTPTITVTGASYTPAGTNAVTFT